MLQDVICLFLGLGMTYTTGRLVLALKELAEQRRQVRALQEMLGCGVVEPTPRVVVRGRAARETWALLREDRAARLAARGRPASTPRRTP